MGYRISYKFMKISMSKSLRQFVSTFGVGILALMAPVSAFAIGLQSDFEFADDNYLYDSSTSEASGAFAIFFFAIWCFFIIVGIFTTIIWVLSIIDIVKRDNWKSENDKLVWLLLVIFINIASLYYYFFHRKKLDREKAMPETKPVETKPVLEDTKEESKE